MCIVVIRSQCSSRLIAYIRSLENIRALGWKFFIVTQVTEIFLKSKIFKTTKSPRSSHSRWKFGLIPGRVVYETKIYLNIFCGRHPTQGM